MHRGSRVDLTIHWGAEVEGLPVPTRVTARQLDEQGRAVGPLGEVEYFFSDQRIDEPIPEWVGTPRTPRR